MHSSSEKIAQALQNPSKLSKVSNLRLSKNQVLRISGIAQSDIEFLRSIKSTLYDLNFIAEMKTGTIVMNTEIKDSLLFDHSIKDKFFIYDKSDLIIIQELTSTYSLEYHIVDERDLRIIQKSHVLDRLSKRYVRESKRVTEESYANNDEKTNIIVCFDQVQEIQYNPMKFLVGEESDALNPEKLLISSECEECKMKTNHIRFCRFSSVVQRADDFGIKGNPLHQIIISWNETKPEFWLVKLHYRIINSMKVLSLFNNPSFRDFLLAVTIRMLKFLRL